MADLESYCRALAEKESIWPLEGRLSNTGGLQRCCLPVQGEDSCSRSFIRVEAGNYCEGQQKGLLN